MTALPVPLIVVQAAAGRVLRAGPAGHQAQMLVEERAFRNSLARRHCPPRVAEAFAISFGRAVEAVIEGACGGAQ